MRRLRRRSGVSPKCQFCVRARDPKKRRHHEGACEAAWSAPPPRSSRRPWPGAWCGRGYYCVAAATRERAVRGESHRCSSDRVLRMPALHGGPRICPVLPRGDACGRGEAAERLMRLSGASRGATEAAVRGDKLTRGITFPWPRTSLGERLRWRARIVVGLGHHVCPDGWMRGWLYLAGVLDLGMKELWAGVWARIGQGSVMDALRMAYHRRRYGSGAGPSFDRVRHASRDYQLC